MPVRNGQFGTDRNTTTNAASVRKQLGTKIARVRRADKRRMVELREESGVQMSLTERPVKSTLQLVGHVERMADDRIPNRAPELREEGRRRRTPQIAIFLYSRGAHVCNSNTHSYFL